VTTDPHVARLRALARRVAEAYLSHTHPRTIFLTGSAAEGTSDAYSDLDVIMLYDGLPSDEAVVAARAALGSTENEPIGARGEDTFAEVGLLEGVEVEVGHATIASQEREMDDVLVRHDPRSAMHRGLGCLPDVIPLHGEGLVRGWQQRAATYPDELRVAVVKHYLRFLPLWYRHERFARRDATVFAYQTLVEGSLNILGVLAGLNRVYFHPFQFKRMRRFIAQLRHAPDRLADRIDGLYAAPRPDTFFAYEELVRDTVDLVDVYLPEVDTTRARRFLGRRQEPVSHPGPEVGAP
jgi:predicted nucleotidyltransferase